jgi:hypothetical protein
MASYRTSLAFSRLSDAELVTFTENVIASLTGNAAFPTPLVSIADITAALGTFNTKLAAAADGGKQATAEKNDAREALDNLLRQEAAYVQSIAGNDLATLLSSGFDATSSNRTRVPLNKPVVDGILNEMSTQLTVRLQPVDNARAYEVRMSYGPNGWQAAGVFTQARRIVLSDLTPGTTYTVQARAVGGTTGYSDWSDPVSHMAT